METLQPYLPLIICFIAGWVAGFAVIMLIRSRRNKPIKGATVSVSPVLHRPGACSGPAQPVKGVKCGPVPSDPVAIRHLVKLSEILEREQKWRESQAKSGKNTKIE